MGGMYRLESENMQSLDFMASTLGRPTAKNVFYGVDPHALCAHGFALDSNAPLDTMIQRTTSSSSQSLDESETWHYAQCAVVRYVDLILAIVTHASPPKIIRKAALPRRTNRSRIHIVGIRVVETASALGRLQKKSCRSICVH
jgi:hypothetical protein